jgi:transposase
VQDLFWISQAQLPYFPLSRGVPRVDDRRVISGIIHVIRNGLRWQDAPEVYGPHKTLYNRFVRWSRMGVFCRIFESLVGEGPKPQRLMRSCPLEWCSSSLITTVAGVGLAVSWQEPEG